MTDQKPEVDLSTLSEADAAFYKQYGRLPKPKPLIKQHKFDSADWAQKKQTGEVGSPSGAAGPKQPRIGATGPTGTGVKKTVLTNPNTNK